MTALGLLHVQHRLGLLFSQERWVTDNELEQSNQVRCAATMVACKGRTFTVAVAQPGKLMPLYNTAP